MDGGGRLAAGKDVFGGGEKREMRRLRWTKVQTAGGENSLALGALGDGVGASVALSERQNAGGFGMAEKETRAFLQFFLGWDLPGGE